MARKLTKTELDEWQGPKFYISHLAVRNPKSTSTPVRIVFNSSQVFNGISLNACLAKGPDSYINNLMGILLRWREDRVAMVADIRKMYNSVYIQETEQHTHRFLWRDLEDRTADIFESKYPSVSKLLRSSTYVDDIVTSVPSMDLGIQLASDTDVVLQKTGFKTKS